MIKDTYTRKVPLALILFIKSYLFISVAIVLVKEIALALFTTISIPPNFATALSTALITWVSSRTSTMQGKALPPAASTEKYILYIINF